MATRGGRSRIEVEALSQKRGKDEIEKGKVGEVLQQFQLHEDTALAYKMQSTEYKDHVSRNKEQRKSVRAGVRTAKETYLEEVKNAGILSDVAEMEQKQWLAEELHKRIEEQEDMARMQQVIQTQKDEELALQVHKEEEKMMKYMEHKRQKNIASEEEYRRLQKIMKELQEAELSDPDDDDDVIPTNDVISLPQNNDIIVLADGTEIDARHNEIQTEEQKRQNMERRDEELAKLLQKQENEQIEKKRTMHEDYRKAIELQDREVAKHLQRQEKARELRRLEKQMRRTQRLPERDEAISSQRRNLPMYHEAVDDFRREDVPPVSNDDIVDTRRYREKEQGERENQARRNPEQVRRNSEQTRRSPEQTYEEVWQAKSGGKTRAVTPKMLESTQGERGGHFSNVAETLDPTYQRASRRATQEEDGDEGDRAGGGKSAPIVPPLKRKTSKEKGKRSRGK